MPKDSKRKYLDKYERGLDFHPDPLVRSGKMSRETHDVVNRGMDIGLGAMGVLGAGTLGFMGNEVRKSEKELDRKRKEYKKSKGSMTQGSFKYGGKVMPKQKPKDFYEGEGYEGSPDMYPDYEEDKKDIKKGKEPQHMGKKYGGVIKKKPVKAALGIYMAKNLMKNSQTARDIGSNMGILPRMAAEKYQKEENQKTQGMKKGGLTGGQRKKNKMKGGGIAIKGTSFKGVF